MKLFRIRWWIIPIWFALAYRLAAQWETQSFTLQPGWNAIYLHISVPQGTIESLVGNDISNPIYEIWEWLPAYPTAQFVQDPATPTTGGSQWSSWNRNGGPSTGLNALTGNAAYLVRNGSASNFVWTLTGHPVAPSYLWTGTGLNFIGFPTPTNAAPSFDQFLTPVPDFKVNADIFAYVGGPLGSGNPQQVLDQMMQNVQRGQAFWLRAPKFNSYYGAISVNLGSAAQINFSTNLGQYSFRLVNHLATNTTVALSFLPSGPDPTSGTNAPLVPLLLRGDRSITTLTYGAISLNAPTAVTLAPAGQPGADVEVVLGVNRYVMNTNRAGTQFTGILRLTDGVGYSQIDIGVSATVGSTAGLWVGNASVTGVQEYLTSYLMATNQTDLGALLSQRNLTNTATDSYTIEANTFRIVEQLQTTNGLQIRYLTKDSSSTNRSVAAPYPFRLIVHNDSGTNVTLLQRVYLGADPSSNSVISLKQSLLDPGQLAQARRISSVHLPWSPDSANLGWVGAGSLSASGPVRFVVPLAVDNPASNPFLHTYHPDHDNRDASFKPLATPGIESFAMSRSILLQVTPPAGDFNSLTRLADSLSGAYLETLTLSGTTNQTRNFNLSGYFSLTRISGISTLTRN
jgi:hypothetical protein